MYNCCKTSSIVWNKWRKCIESPKRFQMHMLQFYLTFNSPHAFNFEWNQPWMSFTKYNIVQYWYWFACATCIHLIKSRFHFIRLTSQCFLCQTFGGNRNRFDNDISWWLFRSISIGNVFQLKYVKHLIHLYTYHLACTIYQNVSSHLCIQVDWGSCR